MVLPATKPDVQTHGEPKNAIAYGAVLSSNHRTDSNNVVTTIVPNLTIALVSAIDVSS